MLTKMEDQPLLEVEALSKSYDGRKVVDGVTLRVGRGEVVGLFGRNGAGKTTTLGMVAGVASDSGRVPFHGKPVSATPGDMGVLKFCDRAYALDNGRIVREGSASDLIS